MREEAPDTQGEEGREAWVRCQKGPAQLVSDAMPSGVLGQRVAGASVPGQNLRFVNTGKAMVV